MCGFAVFHACKMSYTAQCIWWKVQSMNLLAIPITPAFLIYPNIPFSTLYFDNIIKCCSLNMMNQVSHPYKTRKNYIFVYRNQHIFKWQMGRQKMNWKSTTFPKINLLNFYMKAVVNSSLSPPTYCWTYTTSLSPPLTAQRTPPQSFPLLTA